jgi:hypothetical protein
MSTNKLGMVIGIYNLSYVGSISRKTTVWGLFGKRHQDSICKVLLNKDHAMCGKERFIRNQTSGLSLSGSEWGGLAEMSSGLYRRAKPWGRERVSGLQLPTIARWNRSTCLAIWVTGRSWGVLQAEKPSGRETSRGETSGHKSGGLVLVLASGPSACPKNARD